MERSMDLLSIHNTRRWKGVDSHQVERASLDPALVALSISSRASSVQAMPQFPIDSNQIPNYATISDSEMNLMPFPSLPMTCSEYVDSEATVRSSHRSRYKSPSSTYQSSDAELASDVSDGIPTTWSSPDLNDVGMPVIVSASGDSSWMFDPTYMELFAHHPSATSYPSVETGSEFDLYNVNDTHEFSKTMTDNAYIPVVYGQADLYSREPLSRQNHLSIPQMDQARNFPVIKRRRTQTSRTSTSPQPPSNRVNKRKGTTTMVRNDFKSSESTSNARPSGPSGATRSFVCPFAPYGCQSTFATKNEWKRHTLTQHMRMGFWRCDHCPQAGHRPNDFNRKDLFVQHVRRMHPESYTESSGSTNTPSSTSTRNDSEEQALASIAQRCYLQLRTPPTCCSCLFCDLDFEGPHAWDERIEHIGRHLETAKKRGEEPPDVIEWRADHELEQWLADEQIIEWHESEWIFAQDRQTPRLA